MSEAVPGWEQVAPAWERNRARVFESFRPSSEWLLTAADIKAGDTVLEVAAGPGETGFLAGELVGPSGRLMSTDIAPTMVEAARRGAKARGLDNVEAMVMDAQDLDLEDDSVDAVICRLGMMLVPEPMRAFTEVRRVLRSGGRFAYTTIGQPDQNQWMGLMMGALMQNGHQLGGQNPFELGGPFSLSSPERNVELLREAGFEAVQVDVLDGVFRFDGAEDYWNVQTTLAEPVRAVVAELTDEQAAAVRSTLAQMLEPFEVDGSRALPTQVVTSVATA
jgi:SAM-dependent methyltransferase